MIEIVVTYKKDLPGEIARKHFNIKWTHAALFFDYHNVIETNSSGCIKRPWGEFIEDVDEYELYTLEDKYKMHFTEEAVFRAFAHGNIGKAYDFFGLFKIIWQILSRKRPMKYLLIGADNVCSSFVHACYKYIGIDLVPDLPKGWKALPDDLIKSPLLTKSGGNV